ncbi:MAG: 3-phosphoserine/phosphohydroxythreonine transaminase [Bacillota bacterium]
MNVYNFSAGPSMLHRDVKEAVRKDFFDYAGSGMSVTEMSHRSKAFDQIHNEAIALLKELMHISDDYQILFLQGGASTQFDAIPLNLMHTGKADYIVTGNFANKAAEAGARYGTANIIASSKQDSYRHIPDMDKVVTNDDADYIHLTYNNTIFGTRFTKLPAHKAPLIGDISSIILSEEIDVNAFDMLYAGAQKNIGPAGLTIVIIKKSMLGKARECCPIMLDYSTQASQNSLYNTPPCFAIYMAMLTFRWIKEIGGVSAIQKVNEYKAGLLYEFIDNSGFYKNNVAVADRSLMNVPFVTPSAELDAKFIKEAEQRGLVALKGHRLAGGMRASIYNAMPMEGILTLIAFMTEFQKENA